MLLKNSMLSPGTVIHIYSPSYMGDVNGRIAVQSGESKNERPYSNIT
jgi:hypothetical protein